MWEAGTMSHAFFLEKYDQSKYESEYQRKENKTKACKIIILS